MKKIFAETDLLQHMLLKLVRRELIGKFIQKI